MTNETKQYPYSYHAFLFPFEWCYREDKLSTLEEKTDLEKLQLKMGRYSHAIIHCALGLYLKKNTLLSQ